MPPTLAPRLPRDRWKNQAGAFDLPSILVGVVVVGILTAGVLAAIFGVIPWAQDRGVKQDLVSVNTAQGVSYAKDGGFLDKAGLVGAGLLGSGLPEDLDIRAADDRECYVAVGTSGTGEKFIISSDDTSPRALAPGDSWCDGTPVTSGTDTAPDLEPVMISTWQIQPENGCMNITLPITGFNGTVDWGDGTVDNKTSHTYTARGQVKIRIDGSFNSWGAATDTGWGGAGCLISVDRWGATGTTSLNYAFSRANSLKHVESIPAGTTNLNLAFYLNTSNFTLGNLDTSKVKSMARMFDGAQAFNQPLNFSTSNVTNMQGMFYRAAAFNQPLNFDTSSVTTMVQMFREASAFNQPLNFDTSSVTNMSAMLLEAVRFNQPVNFTDTSNVTNMNRMFCEAPAFNQPLNFDTSNVTDMDAMFHGAKTFNRDLSAWNVKKVTTHSTFSNGSIWKLPKPKWVS